MTESRISRDLMYLRMAYVAALRSTCRRRAVGAVAVSLDGRTLAIGYNGNAHDLPNDCDAPDSPGLCGCLHAEENALLKSDFPVGTLYTTCAPCVQCAKRIINANVARVVYGEAYRSTDGLEILRKGGVSTYRLVQAASGDTSGL